MHIFFLVTSLLLVFAAAAIAEPDAAREAIGLSTSSDPQPPAPSEASPTESGLKTAITSPAEIRAKSDSYFERCLEDWDAATHMTKTEWQRTCRRIADERTKFTAEQMGK